MFIVELIYKAPLSEVDKYLPAHREYLETYYQKGLFLASGPQKPRVGGILIALTNDKAYLESVLQNDPYSLAEITEYRLTQFIPVKHRDEIKELILKSEGKLC